METYPAFHPSQGPLIQVRSKKLEQASFVMTKGWQETRATFRHGNLPDALLDAALMRLEAEGAESLSLRELARDVGVNHRAVYRHFPDKLSLLARIAEEGWRRLAQQMEEQIVGKEPGEDTLVAAGVAFFMFARGRPNLFHLMGGPRINLDRRFADLDEATVRALRIFMQGFLDAGTAPKIARARTLVFASALQGVILQILYRRFRLSPEKATGEVAAICKMLIKGLR
jgi:AcrR family transcriptional regulator